MKLIISDVSCQRVSAHGEVAGEISGEYLRCAPANFNGAVIWYVASRNGWELTPDSVAEELEAAFKQEREMKGMIDHEHTRSYPR